MAVIEPSKSSPVTYRWIADVAVRHYLRGETWGEAAERLSVSKRNAQTRLSCALERLSDKGIVTR